MVPKFSLRCIISTIRSSEYFAAATGPDPELVSYGYFCATLLGMFPRTLLGTVRFVAEIIG